ncbi:hypothetical protein DKX38_010566 [Salix brachista]|uniref:Uncharacterized protein n=1 Tax=Salix brachista TaxID=2182728 RepID=A0A5N5MDM2_9ROSI|nr:hypothetical protein DKX38_010566 [Salix brachista]
MLDRLDALFIKLEFAADSLAKRRVERVVGFRKTTTITQQAVAAITDFLDQAIDDLETGFHPPALGTHTSMPFLFLRFYTGKKFLSGSWKESWIGIVTSYGLGGVSYIGYNSSNNNERYYLVPVLYAVIFTVSGVFAGCHLSCTLLGILDSLLRGPGSFSVGFLDFVSKVQLFDLNFYAIVLLINVPLIADPSFLYDLLKNLMPWNMFLNKKNSLKQNFSIGKLGNKTMQRSMVIAHREMMPHSKEEAEFASCCKFYVSSSSKRQRFRSAHPNRSLTSFPPNFLPETSPFSCVPKSLSKNNSTRGEGKKQRKVDDDDGGGGSETRRFRNHGYRVPNSAMSNENDGYDSSSISNHFITAV